MINDVFVGVILSKLWEYKIMMGVEKNVLVKKDRTCKIQGVSTKIVN